MDSKSIFLSKTFWLGAAMFMIEAFQNYVADTASEDTYGLMVAGALVVLNRFITSQAVHLRKPKDVK